MSNLHSLKDLLIDELRDLYSAETQLVKALPKLAKAADNADLKAGFTAHLAQTKEHVARIERSLELLDSSTNSKTCEAMKGLVKEGGEAIDTDAPAAIHDANLIGAATRVEHYEMAAYGTARAFALALGRKDVAQILQQTLDEEGETNKKLMLIGKKVNAEAAAAEVAA